MPLTLKKPKKIRNERADDQPKLPVDKYFVYDNKVLIEDTYTA